MEVLVLPHNSNLSNGQLFYPVSGRKDKKDEQTIAELRRRMEPVVEMFQHKGSGECRNGFEGVEDDPLWTRN